MPRRERNPYAGGPAERPAPARSHRGGGAGCGRGPARPAGDLPVDAADDVGHRLLVRRPDPVVAPRADRPRRLPLRQHPAHRPRPPDAPVAGVEPGADPRRRPAGVEPLQRSRGAPPGQLRVGRAVALQRALLRHAVAGGAAGVGRAEAVRAGPVHLPVPAQGAGVARRRHRGRGRVHVRRLQRAVAGLAPPGDHHLPARRAVLRRGGHAGDEPGAPAAGVVRVRPGRAGRVPGRAPGDAVLRLGAGAGLRAGAAAGVAGSWAAGGSGWPRRASSWWPPGWRWAWPRCSCCPSSSTSTAAPPTPTGACGPRPTSPSPTRGCTPSPTCSGRRARATTSRCSWWATCELPNGVRLASNYIEANGIYVGLLVLLLAAVGRGVVDPTAGVRRGVHGRGGCRLGGLRPRPGRDRPHRGQPAAGGAEHHQPQPPDLGLRRLLPGRLRRRRPAAGGRRPLAVGGGRGRGRGRHARPGRGGAPGPAHAQGGREPRRAGGRPDRAGLGRRPHAVHRLFVPRRGW